MENFTRKSKAIANQFYGLISATETLIAPFERAFRFISSIPSYIDIWVQRANHRSQLLTLDDRLLNDIGLSRAEADKEAKKPFWKA